MKISEFEVAIVDVEASLLAVPVTKSLSSEFVDALASASTCDLFAVASEEGFKGEVGQTTVFRALSSVGSSRIALVGVGDGGGNAYRRAGVEIARLAQSLRTASVAVAVADHGAAEFVEGVVLGDYRFERHLSADAERFEGIERLMVPGGADVAEAQVFAEAVGLARDLVNESPNVMVPEALAQSGRDIASEYGLKAKVFDESELHAEGFNLIMAVGKGSEHPPRLVHLVYKPEGEAKHKVAFVGKGVTFDTGGYNLKPGSSMLNMHCDMAGAAAVLGAAKAIGALKPANVEVHFVVPTAENAIANNSFKPQDIFRGYGGKTVEIHNTDAEGRLILADALAYIQAQGVDSIIDLATLTGACVIALGEHTAGLFTNDTDMRDRLLAAGEASGEHFWPMPLNEKLDELLDTPHADMKNVGPRWGGAITAALFLKRWVDTDRWVHLDIAGPAWAEKPDDLGPKGATGFAVATLVRYVQQLGAES